MHHSSPIRHPSRSRYRSIFLTPPQSTPTPPSAYDVCSGAAFHLPGTACDQRGLRFIHPARGATRFASCARYVALHRAAPHHRRRMKLVPRRPRVPLQDAGPHRRHGPDPPEARVRRHGRPQLRQGVTSPDHDQKVRIVPPTLRRWAPAGPAPLTPVSYVRKTRGGLEKRCGRRLSCDYPRTRTICRHWRDILRHVAVIPVLAHNMVTGRELRQHRWQPEPAHSGPHPAGLTPAALQICAGNDGRTGYPAPMQHCSNWPILRHIRLTTCSSYS